MADTIIYGAGVSPVALKNKIINPDFDIWQRGTSFSTMSAATFTADRWGYDKSGAMVHTGSKSSDVPTLNESGHLSQSSLLVDCTTADASIAASDYTIIYHNIEGYNVKDLAQRPMTLSFWVKATKTGTYSISLRNSGLDRSFVQEYTVSSSDTWEKKAIQVPASPSAGTWDYATGRGLLLVFGLALGSNFTTSTLGSWETGNNVGSTNQVNACDSASNNFYLSQVQLETGTRASEFNTRLFGSELSLCQRYFYKTYETDTTPGTLTLLGTHKFMSSGTGENNGMSIQYAVPMRAIPSVVLYYPNGTNTTDLFYRNTFDSVAAGIRTISKTTAVVRIPSSETTKDAEAHDIHITAEAEI